MSAQATSAAPFCCVSQLWSLLAGKGDLLRRMGLLLEMFLRNRPPSGPCGLCSAFNRPCCTLHAHPRSRTVGYVMSTHSHMFL